MSKLIINAFADESSPVLAEQIDAMKRNGVSGLEVRNVNGKNIGALSNDEVLEVKKALADAGLNTWSIGSAIGKISITDDAENYVNNENGTNYLILTKDSNNISLNFKSYIHPNLGGKSKYTKCQILLIDF